MSKALSKSVNHTVISEVGKNVSKTTGIIPIPNAMAKNAVIAVIAEATIQPLGSIVVSLQLKQTYFSGSEILDGIVFHTETVIFSPHDGQAKIFFQRKIFFMA